jgi:hypothetical protein
VRISDVKPPGLLKSVVYIDLFGVTNEGEAVNSLLNGIDPARGKPINPPVFPSNLKGENKPSYPLVSIPPHDKRVTARDEVEIELKINKRFEDFNVTEQENLLRAIRELLTIESNIKVTKVISGSVLFGLRLSRLAALKLFILNHIGRLRFLNITELITVDDNILSIDMAIDEVLSAESDPPVSGQRETGLIVFVDIKAGYGIIERDRGGFMKFEHSSYSGTLGIGAKYDNQEKLLDPSESTSKKPRD